MTTTETGSGPDTACWGRLSANCAVRCKGFVVVLPFNKLNQSTSKKDLPQQAGKITIKEDSIYHSWGEIRRGRGHLEGPAGVSSSLKK